MSDNRYRIIESGARPGPPAGQAARGEASVTARPCRPVDRERLRGLTGALPAQAEDAATMIRRMRDRARY